MKIIVALCLLGFPVGLFAQQGESSSVQAVDVQPKAHFFGSSGVGVLGLISQTYTEDDQLQELVLRNDGDATVSSFQLAWIVYVPDGCGITKPGIPRREIHLGPEEEHSIKPGETAKVGPYHLSSSSIAAFARNAQSPAVFVQVAVNAEDVEFSGAKGGRAGRWYGYRQLISEERFSFFGREVSAYPCQPKAADGSLVGILGRENAAYDFPDVQPKAHFVAAGGVDSLKWAGQTVTAEDQLNRVTLRNAGKKTITGFQLGWVVYLPDGCGVTEAGVSRRTIRLGSFEERTLKPGETATVGPYHLSSESIAALAVPAHSPAVVAQVGVYRVRYSDGTVTTSDFQKKGSFGPETEAYPCQNNKTVDANVLKTFTSPDGAFQFKYSQILYRCQPDSGQEDLSAPVGTCESQMSICDDDDDSTSTFACFGYPRMEATFAVAEVTEAKTESACLKGPEGWPMEMRGTRTIHGVKFKVFEVSTAWTSGGLSGELYRTFHLNRCYELGIRTVRSTHWDDDSDETEKFTKEDAKELDLRLEQPLNSFRFLK